MVISILIVEDDADKLGRLHNVLVDAGVPEKNIKHALNSVMALSALSERRFDLMLLDINLPRRFGEAARRGGGMDIMRQIARDASLHRPRYVVGVTAYADVIAEFGEEFADQLWTLVHYQETSDRWISQVKSKVEYVRAIRSSDNFTDGVTFGYDLAIVCALELELEAVKSTSCAWQPLRLPHDPTRYWSGHVIQNGRSFSIVAAAAPRMGMAASSVLTSKIIAAFRPRMMSMSGICAGRYGRAELGDVIVGTHTWDWGSGKFDTVNDAPRFRPSPHQIGPGDDVIDEFKEVAADVELLARIKRDALGSKPSSELSIIFGPIASGAAVVADGKVIDNVLDGNREMSGLEMEAYGVSAASAGCSKPRPICVVVKSVCDFADKDKSDDFQNYAAQTSCRFLIPAAIQAIQKLDL